MVAVNRPSRDEWGLALASVVATRGTCLRRQVGCVMMDEAGLILATGYNGRAAGMAHCNEKVILMRSSEHGPQVKADYPSACAAAHADSGTQLDGCEAVHAEANALMQCGDVRRIHTCYTTVSPCVSCVKMLKNTGCERIVFSERYAHDEEARRLWYRATWIHLEKPV